MGNLLLVHWLCPTLSQSHDAECEALFDSVRKITGQYEGRGHLSGGAYRSRRRTTEAFARRLLGLLQWLVRLSPWGHLAKNTLVRVIRGHVGNMEPCGFHETI